MTIYIFLLVFATKISFVEPQCPSGGWWMSSGMFCYYIQIYETYNWTMPHASATCALMNSSLPTFKNETEYNIFYAYWASKNKIDYGFYINLYSYNNLNWTWMDDGSSMVFSNFSAGHDTTYSCVTCLNGSWLGSDCAIARRTIVCQTMRTDIPQPCCQIHRSSKTTHDHRFTLDKTYSTTDSHLVETSYGTFFAFPYYVNGVNVPVYEMALPSSNKTMLAYGVDQMNSLDQSNYTLRKVAFYLPATELIGSESTVFLLWDYATPSDSMLSLASEKASAASCCGFFEKNTVLLYQTNVSLCNNVQQDCNYTTWSTWSACSVTCGAGTRGRNRTLVSPAIGQICTDDSIGVYQFQYCNGSISTCLVTTSAITTVIMNATSATSTTTTKATSTTTTTTTTKPTTTTTTTKSTTTTTTKPTTTTTTINPLSAVIATTSTTTAKTPIISTAAIVTTSTNRAINATVQQQVFNAIAVDTVSSDPISLATAVAEAGPYLLSSMNTSQKMQLGFTVQETIQTCMYNGRNCNTARDFQTTYDPTLGNCFTFNYPTVSFYSADRAGELYGLTLLLNSSQGDYTCTATTSGFRVNIHNASIYPFVDTLGYQLVPGYTNTIAITQVKTSLLGKPYGDCMSGSSLDTYYYSLNYTVEGCMRSCYQDYVISICGCGDPRYPLPANGVYCDLAQKSCVDQISQCESELKFTSCKCSQPCEESDYYPTITTSKFFNSAFILEYCSSQTTPLDECIKFANQNFAVLKVYFQALTVVSYEEQPAYNANHLYSDFSGVTGFLLGVCIITIPEIIIFLCTLCCVKCCR